MKLYLKLMLNYGLVILLALSVVLVIALSRTTETVENAIGSDLEHISESAADLINEFLKSKTSEMKIIASTSAIKSANPTEINILLSNLAPNLSDYDYISFVNRDGFVVSSTDSSLVQKNLKDENSQLYEFYSEAKDLKNGEVVFQDGFYNKKTQEIEIHFLTPVINQELKNTGVLIGKIKKQKINNYVLTLQSKIPGDKPVFLLNHDGKLIVSGDKNDPLWNPPLDAQSNSKIKEIMDSNTNGYVIYVDHTGEEVIAGYADLKEHGVTQKGDWEIFSVAPVKFILTPIIDLKNFLIVTAFITLILVLFLSYFIARWVTTPMYMITKRIEEIAGATGDLTKTIPIDTNDEVGDLARAFNKMIAGIRNIIELVVHTTEAVSSSSQELSSSTQQVSATTQQMAAAVQQIARSSQNQAQKVQGATNVIELMNTNVDSVLVASENSTKASIQANEVAEKGGESMQTTVDKMNSIYTTVTDSAKVIQSLGARSEQIGEIVNVITNIADQTNLLALNAAIEAARAGEFGRGFAVVADEVRKLAEGSAKAAEQIGELIKTIQEETNAAVKAMNAGSIEVESGREIALKTRQSLEEIIMIVQKTSGSVQEITSFAQLMAQGTKDVVNNIEELASNAEESAAGAQQAGTSTEELSASMQQIAASSQELSQMATTLRETVQQFKVKEDQINLPIQ